MYETTVKKKTRWRERVKLNKTPHKTAKAKIYVTKRNGDREREIVEGRWCVSSLSLLIHPSVSLPQCIMVPRPSEWARLSAEILY